MNKKQYRFYIDVPVWTLNFDSYTVIASDEEEAMKKFENWDFEPLEFSEVIEEHREKPLICRKEELKESEQEKTDG